LEELLDAGQALWESLAPSEIQEEYRLPTFEEVTQFLTTIESSLADGDAQSLAPYAEPAKQILLLLRGFEGGDELADWLQPRIDYLVASDEIQNAPPPRIVPRRPGAPPVGKPVSPQFTQQYWSEVIARRPKPKLADRYIPVFKKAFKSKGVPTELVWLSEVESAINLKARSPVCAYGPFQIMPATAERFGLRVGRALKSTGAKEFQQVSSSLPTETRMYVPKVLATVALRESIDPATLSSILSFSDSESDLHASRISTADPPDSYR
jgi:membrane-bound lytic murein transglycosylase D